MIVLRKRSGYEKIYYLIIACLTDKYAIEYDFANKK